MRPLSNTRLFVRLRGNHGSDSEFALSVVTTMERGIFMRKLAVILALASTALASPAFARDKSWYVGVEGGGMIVEDIHYSISAPNAGRVDHNYGYDVDGTVGYDFRCVPGRNRSRLSSSAAINAYTGNTTTPTYTATCTVINSPATDTIRSRVARPRRSASC